MEYKTIEHQLMSDFRLIGGFLRNETGRRSGQKRLLITLRKNGQGMTQKDLQQAMGLKPSTLSEMLDRLEKSGEITRARSKEDGRQVFVDLTDKGLAVTNAMRDNFDRLSHMLFEGLDDAEKQELLSLLEKVGAHFEALKSDPEFQNIILEKGCDQT